MNLTISGHHLDVTPAIREHVEGKFAPIERHGDHITRADVTLVVEKHHHLSLSALAVAVFSRRGHEKGAVG